MASTFTPNIQLNEPARNDDVGTWDTPVNSNMTLIDLVVERLNEDLHCMCVRMQCARARAYMFVG